MVGRREKQEHGGFANRLRTVIADYGSANGLARTIERSEGAVRKWLRGESEPNVTDLRSVCEETRTSVEWLVTGRGRRERAAELHDPPPPYDNAGRPPVDYGLLERVMDAVDAELRAAQLQLPSTKRSMLVVTIYDLCQERQEVDLEAVARLVRLAG